MPSTSSRTGPGSPGPASSTSTRTRPASTRPRTRTGDAPCSTALATRFPHAWASRTGSARTSARPRSGSTASSAPKRARERPPRLGGVVEQRADVDELRALARAPAASRGREVVERERRAPELEVDRGGALLVVESVETQPSRAQRPAELVARVRDEGRVADEPRLEQRGEPAADRGGEPADEREAAHAATASTGPSTRR